MNAIELREGAILFSDVFQNHVDVDIKSPQSPDELLVSLHYHPYLRPYAPVDQLCEFSTQTSQIFRLIFSSKYETVEKETERGKPDGSSCEGLLAIGIWKQKTLAAIANELAAIPVCHCESGTRARYLVVCL